MKKLKVSLPGFKTLAAKIPKPAFFKKLEQVLVAEIGDAWLKMAITQDGKLNGLEACPIEQASDLDISQKISEFAKKQNLKPSEVILSHPEHNLTTRILSLPSTDPKEIKDIVELQAVKQTPYSREEITSGFHIIDTDSAGYSRVMVSIAHRDVTARYQKILELAGFYQSKMTASLEGVRFWFQALCQQKKIQPGEAVLLIDVDWGITGVCVIFQGQIIFSRSLGAGAKNLIEQGAAIESELVREIQRSLESSAAELRGQAVGRIILTGVQRPLKDFSAALVRELNLPCEVMDPVKDTVPAFTEAVENSEERQKTSFVSLTGLALYSKMIHIDLTPAEVLVRRSLERRAKDLAMMGTLLLAFISLSSLICVEKIYKKSNYLNDLKKQYREIQSEAEGVERLVAKMKLAQEQAKSGNGMLDVIRDINDVIPENITLSHLSFNDQEKSVVIRGLSSEMSGVFSFLTTLEGTSVLEQVKTRNVTKRKVEDKELAEFELVAGIQQGLKLAAQSAPIPVGNSAPEIAGAK